MPALVALLAISIVLASSPAASARASAGAAAAAPVLEALGSAHVLDSSDATPLAPGRSTALGIAAPSAGGAFVVGSSPRVETRIGLPTGTEAPVTTPDGSLVYDDAERGFDVAVRALDLSDDEHLRAALQAVIVIDSVDAPTSYRFPLTLPAGGSAQLEAGGAVSVREGDGDVIGLFTRPWAVDAVGQPVRTWFRLAGGALVQHVRPSSRTVFPVVADPFFVVPALVVGGRPLLQIGVTAATRAAASSIATATVASVARLSPGALTARPLSLVAKSRFDRVLRNGVRHYYTRGDAQALFLRITEGGRAVGNNTRVARNGHTATLYDSALTSVPTIHINTGTHIYKVRIVP